MSALCRLGWTVTPTLLAYATGGLAVTDLQVSNVFTDDFAPPLDPGGASSVGRIRAGFVIGGGLEWAAWQGWSFKAEYLFVDFSSVSTGVIIPNVCVFCVCRPICSRRRAT
jgi:outer membrane immunogenic protein